MKHLWTRHLKPLVLWLVKGAIGAAIILFLAFVLAEWASGCGETYIDSKGVPHTHPCMFISNDTTIRK